MAAATPEARGARDAAYAQESLDGWRALTTQMRATLRIARRVHDGLAADDRNWDTLPSLREVLVGLVTPGLEDPWPALRTTRTSTSSKSALASNTRTWQGSFAQNWESISRRVHNPRTPTRTKCSGRRTSDSPTRSAVSRCTRQLNSSARLWPGSSISG